MLLNPTQARALFEDAAVRKFAVLAVNADSPAAIADCLLAARECDAPIIVEASLWQLAGHSFGVGDPFLGLERYLGTLASLAGSERFIDVPVVFHTDHIKGPDTVRILQHAMTVGASSISLDSSELTGEENISTLVALASYAAERSRPATLEMEAGIDQGVTEIGETRALFGAVESACPGYLALWAPGVGTTHGLEGDAATFSAEAVRAHRELASEIAGRPIGIALHGSSGLSDDQLQAGVAAGVAKVNWSSESLLLRSTALRDYFADASARLVKGHRDFKASAMDTTAQAYVSQRYVPAVATRIRTLGGEGKAAAHRPGASPPIL